MIHLSLFVKSLSTGARILGKNSITVTFDPNALNIPANSMPITPPPITAKLLGTSLNSNIFSLVNTPGRVIPGILGIDGIDPVAIIIFFVVISLVSPFVRKIETVFLSFKEAVP